MGFATVHGIRRYVDLGKPRCLRTKSDQESRPIAPTQVSARRDGCREVAASPAELEYHGDAEMMPNRFEDDAAAVGLRTAPVAVLCCLVGHFLGQTAERLGCPVTSAGGTSK